MQGELLAEEAADKVSYAAETKQKGRKSQHGVRPTSRAKKRYCSKYTFGESMPLLQVVSLEPLNYR